MNETLEHLARTLFKDGFVNFGPTKAKQEGRAAYLEGDLWALFPEQLDELGIPEGWRVGELSELIEVQSKRKANESCNRTLPRYGSTTYIRHYFRRPYYA